MIRPYVIGLILDAEQISWHYPNTILANDISGSAYNIWIITLHPDVPGKIDNNLIFC